MRKIPTVFKRDPEDPRRLLHEVHPDCQWVLDGEGVATRKYDGTCCYLDNAGFWYARREVKPGKTPPHNFIPVTHDEATGKTVGWVPMAESSFAKWWAEASRWAQAYDSDPPLASGTYELCGPKINGNPEGYDCHRLIRHDHAEVLTLGGPTTLEYLRVVVMDLANDAEWEGIVWHHPDGRMAKLKGRDFKA